MSNIYDVIILGAGPAGLSAGLYAGRARLSTLILEKGQEGGQIATTGEIENYPGQQLPGESGAALAARIAAQAQRFGTRRARDTIKEAELDGDIKKLVGVHGVYLAKTVILATGATPRPIGCINEAKFVGRGISFCATCDGALFEGLEVYVVGGGDSAVEEAVYLTKFARKVTIIHRRSELRAAKSIQEKAFSNSKISFLWDTVVEEAGGDELLERIVMRNVRTGALTTVEAGPEDGIFGLFGFTGFQPNSKLFEGAIETKDGYVVTDDSMRTSLPGVFAAGDVRSKPLRQVVTAVSDGAIAAVQAEKYLAG